MHIVAVHSWQKDEATVARTIAETLGILVYEARQRIAGGGPVVLASFADQQQAEALAAKLSLVGVPALVMDREGVRKRRQPFHVRRFVLEPQALRLESVAGELSVIAYETMELLLVATCSSQTQTTATVTERKFSLGKTLLAGGVPMSKKVTREETVTSEEYDQTLWLYAQGRGPVIFARAGLSYDGFGTAMLLSRDLNFVHLKNELQRLAPQAGYDERLLKRAGQIRLLGPALSPESSIDLACEILVQTLRVQPAGNAEAR